jgi:hypothetical protein
MRIVSASGGVTGGPWGEVLMACGKQHAAPAGSAAVIAAVRAVSMERPMCVILDDVDAGDAASRDIFTALAARVEDVPVLVLGTYTEPPRQPDVQGSLAALGTAVRLPLPPLGPADVYVLAQGVTASVPPASLCARVQRETGGNPFLVIQTLHALAGEAPGAHDAPLPIAPAVSAWLHDRLETLPIATREALEAASIAGDAIDAALVATILDETREATADRLRAAANCRVLVRVSPAAERYAFTPPLHRDALYVSLSPSRRASMHARAAAALEADGTSAEQALVHWCLAAAAGGDIRRTDAYARRLAHLAAAAHPEMLPDASPIGGARLVCEGEYWAAEFEGRSVRLRHRTGLSYLARLLAAPGTDIPAVSLVTTRETGGEIGRRVPATSGGEPNGSDDAALGDGRAMERARVSTTRRLRDAIEHITRVHPVLGAHLARSIRTGHRCVYAPEPSSAPSWGVRLVPLTDLTE